MPIKLHRRKRLRKGAYDRKQGSLIPLVSLDEYYCSNTTEMLKQLGITDGTTVIGILKNVYISGIGIERKISLKQVERFKIISVVQQGDGGGLWKKIQGIIIENIAVPYYLPPGYFDLMNASFSIKDYIVTIRLLPETFLLLSGQLNSKPIKLGKLMSVREENN